MQDYQTESGDSGVLDEEVNNRYEDLIRTMLKKIVTFVCFGPGLLGVMWIIGRLFKR